MNNKSVINITNKTAALLSFWQGCLPYVVENSRERQRWRVLSHCMWVRVARAL